jgi:hypothetical protein
MLFLLPLCLFAAAAALRPTASSSAPAGLIATPPAVANFGSVKITWPGAIRPAAGDYITYSCGPTNNLQDEIFRCNINATHENIENIDTENIDNIENNINATGYAGHPPQYGNGQCVFFSLVNLRCDYVFAYVRDNATVLASVTVAVADSGHHAPTQGHLAFGDLPSDMFVSWVSGSRRASGVRYGRRTRAYTRTTPTYERASTYAAEDVCNSPANTTSQSYWRHPGFFHHALLQGLTPHTRYFYQYGNDVDGWSEERSFVSRADASVEEVKFIGYGDQDWDEPGSVQTAALVLRDAVARGFDDFVLHFGDLSYGEGDVSDWDHWATQVEPYASRIPYMVSYGNHEYNYLHGKWKDQTLLPMRLPQSRTGGALRKEPSDREMVHMKTQNAVGEEEEKQDDGGSFSPPGGNFGSDSNGECGIAIVHRFRGPSNGRANHTGSLAWYSFDAGPIHVVQMSSEHDWLEGSEQHEWLDQDLARADANRVHVPWVVVTAHRMMYSTQLCEDADNKTSFIFRRHVEPLLLRHHVDVVMVGHQHSYERTCRVRNGTCVGTDGRGSGGGGGVGALHGIVHITAGSAGAGVEKCGFARGASFSLVHSNQWGYLRGRATRQNFSIEFVSDALGTAWDEVVLQR